MLLQIKLTDVVRYVKQFGKTELLDLRRGCNGDFIIVRFLDGNAVHSILKKRFHRISNHILTVKLAGEEPSKKLTHPINLLDLSDKHLLDIFNRLNAYDLCSVAKTCTRFKQIAEQCFSSKFDKITWLVGDTRAEMLFDTFGQLVKSLDVDVNRPERERMSGRRTLQLMADKCSNELRHLNLWMNIVHTYTLDVQMQLKLKSIFSGLHRLDLDCHELFEMCTTKELLSSCFHLKTLSLNCTNARSIGWNGLNVHFPNLRELIICSNKAINDFGLDLFFKCNPQITKLYLDEYNKLTSNIINIIVHRLPELEEITLGFLLQSVSVSELRPLGGLKHLKSVTILLGPAIPILTAIHQTSLQIEQLALWYVDIGDDLVTRLLHVKSIRKLEMFGKDRIKDHVNDNHLKLLSTNLVNLNHFRIVCSENVTLSGVKEMIFNAKNLLHLSLSNMKNISTKDKDDLMYFAMWYCKNFNLSIEIDCEH